MTNHNDMHLFQEIKHKLLILGCLFAGAIIADAKDVTIDFSAQGYANAQDMPKSIMMDEYITLQFGYGVIPTKYYTSGSAVRIYGKGSVTINTSDPEKPITQIVYTFAKPDAPTSSNASFSGGGTIIYEETSTTWTGSSNSVTITRASGNGHWKLQKVVVTYTDSSTPVEPSFVTVDGIAGLQTLESGTKTRLHWTDGMNARVLYSNEELTFVRDESADDGSFSALCLRGVNAVANNPLHSNQHLSGWVIGKYKVESGMPVFECTDETNTDSLVIAEPVTEADVMPIEVIPSQMSNHFADYVILKDLRVSIIGTDTLIYLEEDVEHSIHLCNSVLGATEKGDHFTGAYEGAIVDVTGMVWADEDGIKLAPVYVNDNVPIIYVFDQNRISSLPPADIEGATVRFNRTISSEYYNTLCLPVDWEINEGDAYVFSNVEKTSDDESIVNVEFRKSTSTIGAGTAFITKPLETIDGPVFYFTTLHAAEPQPVTIDEAYSFTGCYHPIDLHTETDLFLGAGNQFYYPSTTGYHMPGLRAFLTVPSGTLVKSSLNPMDDEIADVIHIIHDKKDFKDERIYSLSGQFLGIGLENLENGVYIINNEKYLLK